MHPLVWVAVLVGGVAVWRRKHLKSDAVRAKTAALDAKAAATERIAAARGDADADADEASEEASDEVNEAPVGDGDAEE
jgi:hypothetical protein